MTEEVVLRLDDRDVRVTSSDKVFFPQRGETKLDLIRYYERVRTPLLATLGGRPLLLQRFPDGARGKSFFQKRVPKGAPDWLTTTTVLTVNGTPSNALVGVDLAHIAWAVNMGCLGFHVWAYQVQAPAYHDELRLDLDPAPGVGFEAVRRTARLLHELLLEHGVRSFPKTTGQRGIHVYVRLMPRWDSYEVRAAALAVAREMEARHPDIATAAWWKEQRGERVFVDFNQNAPHKTVFGAWSVRPKVGGQVSAPLRWDELDDVDPAALTITTVPDRLDRDGDPWAEMYDDPQDLRPLLALHRDQRRAGAPDGAWPPVYPKMPDEPTRVAPSRAREEP